MVAQAPGKHPVAVKIVILTQRFRCRPQPDVLLYVSILDLADGEIGGNPVAFRVLRDLIGNSEIQSTR